MTVSSSFTDKVYQITGTTTVFAWRQDYDSHYGSLVVTEETAATGGTVVTTYVEGTDYTISNRNVVFNTAPSDTTHYIRITRDTYKGQPVVFNEGEDFPAEDFSNALDRLAMVAQEQAKGLADEKSARISADETLQTNITAEENRAKGVEGSLSNLTTTDKTNLVAAINEVDGDISTINTTLGTFGDIVTHDVDEFATASQGAKADTAVQPSDLATVATSGDYNDLSNKPSIPTVNNATLTIKQGGTTKGTFTANASSDVEILLDAGGLGGVNWGDIGGTLSDQEDLSAALSGKQTTLVSGTNIKTINSNSILGGGNLDIDGLPSQTGQSGKFLTTNGSAASWGTIDLSGYQTTSNLVTSVSSASTDSQYPSAKLFYDTCGDIETLINAL